MTKNVLVFAIVGMGGIGKTTLAQLIFNDDTIKGHFTLKFWVYVSKNFNENDLLREVITGAGGDHNGATSRNQLETKMLETLKGKKFMLVLDDVWNISIWDKLLRNPLSVGAVGSRVLVTSRDELIAKQMKAFYCHHVDILSPEDGWSLICRKLVSRGREEEIEHLKDIGIKIVEKCGRLPLAINAMVGALCTKSRSSWELVLRSTAWSSSGLPEEVNKALFLSYLHLPSHLKQCFMYLFLLPKDCEFSMQVVFQLWIAEGFIKDQYQELSVLMEETGELYYKELIWRNFIQPENDYIDFFYVMHDLFRSLAGYLAQDESLFVDANEGLSNKKDKWTKLRRLSIAGGELQREDILRSKDSLRTLILFKNQSKKLNGLFEHLPCLRILELAKSELEELPNSLTHLTHLRYLGLRQTQITTLPENIGDLKNLQYLNIDKCKKLERLPNSIVNLRNLRFLEMSESGVKAVPAGIGSLCYLTTLDGYLLHSVEDIISTGQWSTLKDLGPLLHLRLLSVDNLERASRSSEAGEAALKDKSHLSTLFLQCTSGWVDDAIEVDITRTQEVFELLQPPSCVELLKLKGYPGRRFPDWMTTSVFSNLTLLFLEECKYCEELPPLGLLPNLVNVMICNLPSINSIGAEFMGTIGGGASTISFPKLKWLSFEGMSSCEKWQWERESHAMPCLQFLHLQSCPKLISLPEGLLCHATSLTKLAIREAHSLESVGNIHSLAELEISNSSSLKRVSNLTALKEILIQDCHSVEVVENLSSLQFMGLVNCEMDSLPDWLWEAEQAPKPKKLVIRCNHHLFEKICQMGEAEWTKIQHINQVEIHSDSFDKAYASYTKHPFNFTKTVLGSTSGASTSQ